MQRYSTPVSAHRRMPSIFLTAFLILTLAWSLPAQDAGGLSLLVISGNGAVNDIYKYAPTPTIIEVRDSLDQPVAGATVSFTFPEIGPSGRFADGTRTWTATTDPRGRVTMSGFVPNRSEGSYQIGVDAVSSGRSATVMIRETNAVFTSSNAKPKPRMGSGARILIVLGIGGAVAAGSLLAIKGGSSGTGAATPATSISIGTISIGAPH